MSLSIPLNKMTQKEKLLAMEVLWDDLCNTDQSISSPEWHQAELEQRAQAVESGTQVFEDWETAKENIKKAIS
ncbi:MAG: addiction module protein [Gammaproteobacteria bacterium]|nr:addiction module protein [Gammaproteobacteria bacterium]